VLLCTVDRTRARRHYLKLPGRRRARGLNAQLGRVRGSQLNAIAVRQTAREESFVFAIREERTGDREAVHRVNCAAFPTSAEAALVDHLHDAHAVYASLVALSHELIVGHALFSHACIRFDSTSLPVGALGPVAVLPDCQRRGAGESLIRAGLERSSQLGLDAVIVLGAPHYYGRFGFRRADTWNIRCEFDAPPEAFMIAWLSTPTSGPAIAQYHPAFNAV